MQTSHRAFGVIVALASALLLALPGPAVAKPSSDSIDAVGVTPPVNTVRQWLGLNDFNGTLYRKDYTLRGVGEKIEVWVASDLAFPTGDCRSTDTTAITDTQIADLISQFDDSIYPSQTSAFQQPPDRDGSNSGLGSDPDGQGGDYTGEGDNLVVLIDNIRDEDYYDIASAEDEIQGFFSAQFADLFDRNVVTLDAFDWAHRTGANPADEPSGDPCTDRPAQPRLYESILSQDLQHLTQSGIDPAEAKWVTEGLAAFTPLMSGYFDPTLQPGQRDANRDLVCFAGYGQTPTPHDASPEACGGPENSLNLWTEGEHADRGHALALMIYLRDRFGIDFLSRLNGDAANQGLDSLEAALQDEGAEMYEVLHDFRTMLLVDKAIGESPEGTMTGAAKERVTSASLRSSINLASPESHSGPGAPPNGADFVRLEDSEGGPLGGSELEALAFSGAELMEPEPLRWLSDLDTSGDGQGEVLWSGNGSNFDASAVIAVTVPNADPTLRFEAKYGAEFGYDYGYVMVSTDGGETYSMVAGDKTVTGPLGPALNGTTNDFETHTFDLSAYAGQSIHLGFRYVSDGGVNEGGLRIDDIRVGATVVSDGTNLDEFKDPTEIRPIPVDNWNLRIVGIDAAAESATQVEVDGQYSATLSDAQLGKLAAFPTLVAVVSHDDPSGTKESGANYTLDATEGVNPGLPDDPGQDPQPEPEPDPQPRPDQKPEPKPAPAPPSPLGPILDRASVKKNARCVGARRGRATRRDVTVRFTLNRDAKVTLRLQRRVRPKSRAIRFCPKPRTRRLPRVTYRNRIRFNHRSAPRQVKRTLSFPTGPQRIKLLKTLRAKRIVPGRYRVLIVARATDGKRSTRKALPLLVLKRSGGRS